jgi:hypothetical protein
MEKIYILIISLVITSAAFSQKKLANTKIGKNEVEISSFILSDYRWAFGGQLVYRLSWKKNLKIGAGGLYGVNYENDIDKNIHGYGAAFADIMQFIGHRQKWGFSGQIGHGFYRREASGATLKAGVYWSISSNYRAIVSKKFLISTSLFAGYRNFHYKDSRAFLPNNSELIGLRAGIVF